MEFIIELKELYEGKPNEVKELIKREQVAYERSGFETYADYLDELQFQKDLQRIKKDIKKYIADHDGVLQSEIISNYDVKFKNRIYDYVPLKTPKNTTLLSSIRLENASMVHKELTGAVNGETFLEYIRNALAPTLKVGDIVIMDNLSVHKVAGVRQAIEEKGASVLYLPPYSPDLNPIEMLWSKIKAFLRKRKARETALLANAISEAYAAVSCEDILGWFSAAGYVHSFLELL